MKLRKRIVTGLLALALAGGTAAAAPAAEAELPFADVEDRSWYREAVEFCWEKGLMNGVSDREFDPFSTMTRGMLATVLYRMEGAPAVEGENPFDDVEGDSWYGPAVLWAAEQGLVEGYGDGRYGPSDEVTREQLATVLWRYDGAIQPDGMEDDYLDEGEISDWASQAVDWSRENDIILCLNLSYFDPGEPAMRCELAIALMNYVNYEEEKADWDAPSDGLVDPVWEVFRNVMGYLPDAGEVRENGYDMELFVPDGSGYMTYANGQSGVLGVDVSSYQKEVDWQEAAAAGVEFAIIRVGYRGYTQGEIYPDSCFRKNIEGALAAGLEVGVYFFSQAITVEEALEEARYTLQMIRDYPITYPVVYDWEEQDKSTSRTQGLDEDIIVACARAFCDTVSAAGYTPMFYACPSMAYGLDLEYLTDYPFWLAHYTKEMVPTTYKYHFDIWQYTSKGSVPGIEGNVDLNICMKDF